MSAKHVLVLLVLLLTVGRGFIVQGADISIERCVVAIDSIKSYDVTFLQSFLSYPGYTDIKDSNNLPHVDLVQTNRDVFAIGVGRYFEEYIGDKNHSIGVLNFRNEKNGSAMRNTNMRYCDYINPVIDFKNGQISGCYFLESLLTNRDSRLTPIKSSPSNNELVGFKLENTKLQSKFILLWIDVEHGYLPRKVEHYLKAGSKNGSDVLNERMQVDEFKKVEGGGWVPTKGIYEFIAPVGELKGRTMFGCKIEVDLTKSSWNASATDSLFLEKSLARVNYQKDGWKYDLCSARLATEKGIDAAREAEHLVDRRRQRVKWIFFGVMTALTGVVFFTLIKNRSGKS